MKQIAVRRSKLVGTNRFFCSSIPKLLMYFGLLPLFALSVTDASAELIYVLDRNPEFLESTAGFEFGSPGEFSGQPFWNSASFAGAGSDSFAGTEVNADGDCLTFDLSTDPAASPLNVRSDFDFYTGNDFAPRVPGSFSSTFVMQFSTLHVDSDLYGVPPEDFQNPEISLHFNLNLSFNGAFTGNTSAIVSVFDAQGNSPVDRMYTAPGTFQFSSVLPAGDYTLFVESFAEFDETLLPLDESYSASVEVSAFLALTSVPEPSSITLFGGLMLLSCFRRRRKHQP